jgi:hypothetical protein
MLGKFARFTFAALLLAGAAGCSKEPAEEAVAATATPQGAVDAAVKSLRAGDIKALVEAMIPPKHLAKVRAEWPKKMAEDPPSDAEKEEFAANMAELTAPDAETKLMEKLEPQLVKYEQEVKPQMAMMIGMGKGLILSGIQENKDLTDPQKQQAAQSVEALAKWMETTEFADRERAKKAVNELVATARELNLKSLDEARALSFDQALDKGSIALRGTKKVLDAYGFSIDKMLDSVKTEVLSQTGKEAKVKVSYTMFDQPLSFETELVEVDGRWYGKQTIAELEKPDVAEAPAADAEGAPAESEAEDAAAEPATEG